MLDAVALGIDVAQQPDALAALRLRLGRPVVHADHVQEEVRRVVLRQALQPQAAEVRRLQQNVIWRGFNTPNYPPRSLP